MFLVFFLYALFASVFTLEKFGLAYSPPLFLVGSQMFLAGVIMLSYQYTFDRKEFQFKASSFWLIIRLAIFNIYLNNAFEFLALQYLDSFKICFFYSLSPFVAALFSYFIFAESLSWKKWLGLAIGFVGILPILMDKSGEETPSWSLFNMSWQEGIMLLAAVSSVYGWILLRQMVKLGYAPVMANGLGMIIGGVIALINSYLMENWDPIPVTNYLAFLQCTLLLILVSNLICYNLYGYLLKKFSATFMSFAGFLTPLFTAFYGWVFLGEIITWPFFLSAFIVFLGLLLFSHEELRSSYRSYPEAAVKKI